MNEAFNYLEEYCNSEEAKKINSQLKSLYRQWHDCKFLTNKEKYNSLSVNNLALNMPLLLTCTDAYLDKRVMLFGQEAHDTSSLVKDFETELEHRFAYDSRP